MERASVVAELTALLLGALAACGPGAAAPGGGAAAPPAATGAGGATTAASNAPTAAPAPLRLTANYAARGTGHSGLWLAYEGGYFREQGLDVTLTNISSTAPSLQAMVAGEVQVAGLDPGATIQASVGGADVVLLFAGSNRPLHSIIVQPRIADPRMLRGGIMGITRLGSATHTAALLALDMWGLAPDRDVALRGLTQNPAIFAALQAGQIDAGVLSLPHTIAARHSGYPELLNLAGAGIDYPTVVIGALRPWAAANEEALRRFARAFVQGIQRFRTDQPWALDVYRRYLDLDDPEILDAAYAEYLRCCPTVPYVSEAGIGRLLADLAADEPRLAGRQPAEYVDSHFLQELEASGFVEQVMGPR
jgi:NitT/TauT family transport system substrate-binding protein